MGYSGGVTENPTYRSLGDHAETLEIDFDPVEISYADLLNVFWRSHDPRRPAWSSQYRSAIFYHNEAQKKLAMETREREAERARARIHTELVPASTFYRAEDYHQKYYLRSRTELVAVLKGIYPTEHDLADSTVAARLNGYLAGYGSFAGLEQEMREIGLSENGLQKVLNALRAAKR